MLSIYYGWEVEDELGKNYRDMFNKSTYINFVKAESNIPAKVFDQLPYSCINVICVHNSWIVLHR